MKCEEVKEKLPEYLAGILDESTKTEVDRHLKSCHGCREELDALNKSVALGIDPVKDVNEQRIMKKTKVKFNLMIVRTVVVVLGILLLLSQTPTFLWGIQSSGAQSKATRALMDVVQFSQPNKVNMWGNSAVQGFTFSVPLKIGTCGTIGRKYAGYFEYIGKMSVITGKVTVPHILGASFVHPDLFLEQDFGRDQSVEVQTQRLQKNAETSVATVDYSLNKIIKLSDVENLISQYDLEVCWMAVEAGIEDTQPKNMSFGNQQILQWGIPGKLSQPGSLDFIQLQKGNAKEFEESVLKELQWLEENKGVLKPESALLKNNGIDTSVKEQAQYVLKNGINIYGIRITGPADELIKLTKNLDARTMSVIEMDFWNW